MTGERGQRGRRRWSRRWRPDRKPPTQPPLRQRVCVLCGAPFLARRSHARLCSALCRKRLERSRRDERARRQVEAAWARWAQQSLGDPRKNVPGSFLRALAGTRDER